MRLQKPRKVYLNVVGLIASWIAAAWAAPGAPPVCKIISGQPGGPAILVNGQTYSPMLLAVNNQFGRDDVLVDEIRLAGAEGVQLISFNLWLDWHQPAEQAAKTVARFCEANPTAYFYVRIWVGPNQAWLDDHPDEQLRAFDGTRPMMASPSSERWRSDAAAQLQRRIDEILRGPYGDRFLGAMPTYLQTGEWFYPDTERYWDYSPANEAAFRAWLKKTYRRAKALRTAWADPNVTFETAKIPSPEEREATVWGPFRDPVAHRPAMDLGRFQSDAMVETIEHFCRTIKKATRNRALTGAFYGYTFELNHNGPRALAQSGHLALAALLNSPYIDLIHAPYAYFERTLGDPGHFHLPIDSVALHHKLAIIEEDSFTHLSAQPDDALIAPGWEQRTSTMDETFALTRRNFGTFMMHRAGFWWFDLLSDGRWNSTEFWKQTGMLRRIAARLRDTPRYEPEIAFVVDETSIDALADNSYPYLLHTLGQWRAELGRIGAPVGYYLQSDLAIIPRTVRLFVMANAYRLPQEHERELRRRLDQGATVVWTFAPGAADRGPGIERIQAVTGMNVVEVEDEFTDTITPVGVDATWAVPSDWKLRFAVSDASARPLAHYGGSATVAAAEVAVGKGFSVYTAVPGIPATMLRQLSARAGAHLYIDTIGKIAVAGDYVFVHTDDAPAATHTLCWPESMGMAVRMVPEGIRENALDDAGCWQDTLPAHTTAIYRMDERKPLQHRLLEELTRQHE